MIFFTQKLRMLLDWTPSLIQTSKLGNDFLTKIIFDLIVTALFFLRGGGSALATDYFETFPKVTYNVEHILIFDKNYNFRLDTSSLKRIYAWQLREPLREL